MTIRTYIDADVGIAVQKLSGAMTAVDVVDAQRNLYVAMGVHPKLPCLWDVTEGDVAATMDWTGMKLAVEGSEAIWDRMRGGRTAILVADEADFGMGRMYATLAENMPREIRVFYSRPDAIAWLTADPVQNRPTDR